jgi:hypothetical protein
MLNLFVEDIDFWEFRFVEKERKGKERKGGRTAEEKCWAFLIRVRLDST